MERIHLFNNGTELFESTKKCCDKCLTCNDKNGTKHYFHTSIVCSTVGSDPHIIIFADALYCKFTWVKEVLPIGMDAFIRVKGERLHIFKDALALFKCSEANKEWRIQQGNKKYTIIKAWDEDNFEMSDSNIKVRFLKFTTYRSWSLAVF